MVKILGHCFYESSEKKSGSATTRIRDRTCLRTKLSCKTGETDRRVLKAKERVLRSRTWGHCLECASGLADSEGLTRDGAEATFVERDGRPSRCWSNSRNVTLKVSPELLFA